MNQEKPGGDSFFKQLISDYRKIILLSIAVAVVMALFGLLDVPRTQGALIACAVLWGSGLIALAIIDKKNDSNPKS